MNQIKMTENMKSLFKRLADMGIAEHIGRNRYINC